MCEWRGSSGKSLRTEVIDHNPDFQTLRQRYGRTAVMIIPAKDVAETELVRRGFCGEAGIELDGMTLPGVFVGGDDVGDEMIPGGNVL